jgi:hypothetical protein
MADRLSYRLLRRLGRRGAFLLFLAILDAVYGWSIYTAAVPKRQEVDLLLPWQAWGVIWYAVGFVCLIAAWFPRDRIAYATAAALKFGWGAVSGFAWANQPALEHNGWLSMIVWFTFGATVLIISGWPEPPRLARTPG